MPTVIPVGYGEAMFMFQLSTLPRQLTFTIGYHSTPSPDPDADATAIVGWFGAAGRPFEASNMGAAWTWTGVQCRVQTEPGLLIGENIVNRVGTATFSAVPVNTAMLVRKRTALGGRRNSGRLFVPLMNFDEVNVSNIGVISTTVLGPQQTRWTAAMTAFLASALEPVVLHSQAGLPTPITSLVIQQVCATQRKRMRP